MKFLCGRPACGQESTATLQIDAASSTVSLVDPRTSRDGVPLCARHADATTPPVGWTMNDLRSTAGVVNGATGVVDRDGGITSAPPRVRPDRLDGRTSGKMSRRQSIAERARREAEAGADLDSAASVDADSGAVDDLGVAAVTPTLFDDDEAREKLVTAKLAERATRREQAGKGPSSRPARRRDSEKPTARDEDGFPWTFSHDDEDEPQELQASTPLLSRAFRASTA